MDRHRDLRPPSPTDRTDGAPLQIGQRRFGAPALERLGRGQRPAVVPAQFVELAPETVVERDRDVRAAVEVHEHAARRLGKVAEGSAGHHMKAASSA